MAKQKTIQKWWQALRVAVATTTTIVVVLVWTNQVAKFNFETGIRVGMSKCYRPQGSPEIEKTLFEGKYPSIEDAI